MHVLSTIVQKGGDCKSKVFPPCVLDIVGQDNRGTKNVFECKQLIRFLKDKLGDKASRMIYNLSKHNTMSQVLSRRVTPKNDGFLKLYSSKEMKQTTQDLDVFV